MKFFAKFILILLLFVMGVFLFLPRHNLETVQKEKKILYYRDPMGKDVTSPVPAKDEMGMDFIPVYEETADTKDKDSANEGRSNLTLSKDSAERIGVTKDTATEEQITYEIKAKGRVAYDPGLYQAAEEFITSFKMLKSGSLGGELIKASKTKLRLLGLSEMQIDELSNGKINPQSFLLPSGKAWIYAEVYEYDLPNIKNGMKAEATSPVYPEKIFTGQLDSISPIVNDASRTVRLRTTISDPDGLLKPDMYLNVSLTAELGRKITVSDSAVIHTGNTDIIFIIKDKTYSPRQVKVGTKINNRYVIEDGLSQGEVYVKSGNFLLDSESRVKNITSGS